MSEGGVSIQPPNGGEVLIETITPNVQRDGDPFGELELTVTHGQTEADLKAENAQLRARVADLEEQLKIRL